MNARRITALVVSVVAFAAIGGSSADASWSVLSPASGFVDGGRVWWMVSSEASGTPGLYAERRIEMRSRALGGGAIRRTPLAVQDLVPPPPEPVRPTSPFVRPSWFSMSVDAGVLVGSIGWSSAYEAGSGDGGITSSKRTQALFDLKTGRLLRADTMDRSSDRFMFTGSPAVLGPVNGDAKDLSLVNAIDGRVYGARAVGTQSMVAGRRIATYEGATQPTREAWARDGGWLRVADLASGAEHYRVRAREIRRRAGAARAGRETTTVQLLPDGALQTTVRQVGSRSGLRPTWVDHQGRIRTLPWRIPSATTILVTPRGGRVILQFQREGGTRSRPTACEEQWIFNRTGTRGRQLAPRDRSTVDWAIPAYWDRRYTVFWSERTDDFRLDQQRIRVDDGLSSRPLPKARRPICTPRA